MNSAFAPRTVCESFHSTRRRNVAALSAIRDGAHRIGMEIYADRIRKFGQNFRTIVMSRPENRDALEPKYWVSHNLYGGLSGNEIAAFCGIGNQLRELGVETGVGIHVPFYHDSAF